MKWLDAEYAPYITPMVLAAKLEQIEAIKILHEHGSSDIHPLTGKIFCLLLCTYSFIHCLIQLTKHYLPGTVFKFRPEFT